MMQQFYSCQKKSALVAETVSWSARTASSEFVIKKLKSLTKTVAWNVAHALKTVRLMLSL